MKTAVALLAVLGLMLLALLLFPAAPPPQPAAPVIVRPRVIVPPPHRPKPCPGPFCPRGTALRGDVWRNLAAQVSGRIASDGTPLSVDYPEPRHLKNRAGTDGAGLCVYASNAMALDWHGYEWGRELLTFMEGRPGGGYPRKTDADLAAFFKAAGANVPRYLHYEGADLSVLDRAVSAGRMVCGTYYRSPTGRYGGKGISHMVNWVHADGKNYCVMDNNHPGGRSYEWMNRAEADKTIRDGRGKFWLVIWLDPPPPPVPHNPKESF